VRHLLLLFIIIPILEMWVLIQVGNRIGAFYTIGLVLLTALIGINLLRQQGLSTLWRAQQRMNSGQIPVLEMVEGLLLAVGGALLLTPGFVTDGIGFVCLLPGLRQVIVARMAKHFTVMQAQSHTHSQSAYSEAKPQSHTIDGDFERHDP